MGIDLWGLSTLPGINLGTMDNNLNKSLSFGPTSNFSNAGVYHLDYAQGLKRPQPVGGVIPFGSPENPALKQ